MTKFLATILPAEPPRRQTALNSRFASFPV